MTTSEAPPQLRVGARCEVGGKHKATIRYIGTVDGQQGEWVGLEWDDASRGKHDGSYGGRRYFQCSSGQETGSFVRLAKLLEALSLGYTLLEALHRRYAGASGHKEEEGIDVGAAGAELFVPTSSGRRVTVELVGADQVAERLADLASLEKAAVVGEGVSSLGDPSALVAELPSLSELDLSDNLISNWSFVEDLLQALPSLRVLNLSRNRLALPAVPSSPPPCRLSALSTLVLNGCGVGWPEVVGVARQLPSLAELHLRSNGIPSLHLPVAGGGSGGSGSSGSKVPDEETAEMAGAAGANKVSGTAEEPPTAATAAAAAATAGSGAGVAAVERALAEAFGHLRVLDLEDNELGSWGEVQLLSTLPMLQSLMLSGNALPSVRYTEGFTSLSSLLVGRNRLASWDSVDQLSRFPALTDTRLTDNPLLAGLGSSGRYEVIARVGRLAMLNASQVTKMERWDAELNYLRHVTDALAAAGKDGAARAALLASHPRFPELTAKYGRLEAPSAAAAPAAGSSLSKSMVELVLWHNGKELRKKLPVSLTVGKLKLMIEKLLRVRVSQQALLLLPPTADPAKMDIGGPASSGGEEEGQPEDITDDDSRELRYFNLSDGFRVQVSEADPAARAQALAKAKQEASERHQQRMEQQEKMIQQFRVEEERLMA